MSIRHELKYLISPIDAHVLARRFSMLFARDRHAGVDGSYVVRSLYFDTPDDLLLRMSKDGMSRREKWRLRTYGDECRVFRLEKKAKCAGASEKSSCQITPDEARAIVSDVGPVPWNFCDRPVLKEFRHRQVSNLLRPVSVIAYRREAFTYALGNVRLTLDSHVASSTDAQAIINPALPLVPVAPGSVILEVKYDAFIPDIVRHAIETPGAQRVAWSKYVWGRHLE